VCGDFEGVKVMRRLPESLKNYMTSGGVTDTSLNLLRTAFLLACDHLAEEYGETDGTMHFVRGKLYNAGEELGMSDDETAAAMKELGIDPLAS
jgi:hypothetical protein